MNLVLEMLPAMTPFFPKVYITYIRILDNLTMVKFL